MARDDGPRRLTLGRDRKLGGVCSGIADYCDLDPTVVRVGFVLLVLLPFLPLMGAVFLYAVLWAIMPAAPAEAVTDGRSNDAGVSVGLLLGAFLVLLGGLVLFQKAFAVMAPAWWGMHAAMFVWPAVLVLLGVLVMTVALRR